MGLFDNYNEIEKGLLEMYSQIFNTMGIPEAKKLARNLLDQAIKTSKVAGTYNSPPNLSEILLEKEKIDEKTHQAFEEKRKEGVGNEDIRWWFDMHDVERAMILKVDELHRVVSFIEERKKGRTAEEAYSMVRKYYPIYGDPKDETYTKGDDRPLPIELKDRINIYIEKSSRSDPEKFKKDIEVSSTFNALIRKEIRMKNI